jgi:hypothetical protein
VARLEALRLEASRLDAAGPRELAERRLRQIADLDDMRAMQKALVQLERALEQAQEVERTARCGPGFGRDTLVLSQEARAYHAAS